MKKLILTSLYALITSCVFSQTGPGGIGTSDGSSSLELWINSDSSVHTSGALVDSVLDLSGNGLKLMATGTNRPDLTATGLNGLNYLSFERTNFEKLDLTSDINSIGINDARTILYVYRYTTSRSNLEMFGTSTGKMVDYGAYNRLSRLRIRNSPNNSYSAANTVSINNWHIGSIRYNGTNTTAWNNNTQILNESNNRFGWDINASFDIGAANFNGRSFTGNIAEIILFSSALNSAQRIIIENYLSAKYGLSLNSNDVFNEDDAGNGNYDHDVAGIGRVDASNIHNDAQGTGIVRILNPGGLGDNEFLIWGHNNGTQQATDTTDIPATIQARFDRVWRASEVNSSSTAVDVGSIDVQFDLTGLGGITASDLRLLVDTDNDGAFNDETPIAGATSSGSNVYQFADVTAITNNLRFTLGTMDTTQTPLPIELISFNANLQDNKTVRVDWQTASETNNDYFTVERSTNGVNWQELTTIEGKENYSSPSKYEAIDNKPYSGISYYRLKQTDLNGRFTYSKIEMIDNQNISNSEVKLFPNPTKSQITIVGNAFELNQIKIYSIFGQDISSSAKIVSLQESALTLDLSNLKSGFYFIKTKTTANKVYKQ